MEKIKLDSMYGVQGTNHLLIRQLEDMEIDNAILELKNKKLHLEVRDLDFELGKALEEKLKLEEELHNAKQEINKLQDMMGRRKIADEINKQHAENDVKMFRIDFTGFELD